MSKLNNKRGSLITAAIILVIFLFVGIAEQVAPSSWDMLFMVLKKGAIYALIGVSMNLLNGFTGLFSLGQAGFMLLGGWRRYRTDPLTMRKSSIFMNWGRKSVQRREF